MYLGAVGPPWQQLACAFQTARASQRPLRCSRFVTAVCHAQQYLSSLQSAARCMGLPSEPCSCIGWCACRHVRHQQRRHHQTCRGQQQQQQQQHQPYQTDCGLPSSCAAGDNRHPVARHAHAAEPRRRSSSAPPPASDGLSRRQAMQRAAAVAAAAAAAAWLPAQHPPAATAADGSALMVAPPTAQAPQGGARPSRGNPLRRIGLVRSSPVTNGLSRPRTFSYTASLAPGCATSCKLPPRYRDARTT